MVHLSPLWLHCCRVSTSQMGLHGRSLLTLPWMLDDGARFDLPLLQYTLDVGLELRREQLLDLILIAQFVTFCHRSLIGV